MKKNGFTLIEILGVITILALLSMIITISANKSLKDAKETLTQVQIEEIKSAASMWRTDNIEIIPNTGYYEITLKTLQESGYIKENVKKAKSNNTFEDDITIKIGMNDIQVDITE